MEKAAAFSTKLSSNRNGHALLLWCRDDLSLFPDLESTKSEITELGRKFSIVTSNTSLIVLETLSQYLRHNIEPPASLPEIRKQYLSIMASKKTSEKEKVEAKVQHVLDMWNKRVHRVDTFDLP